MDAVRCCTSITVAGFPSSVPLGTHPEHDSGWFAARQVQTCPSEWRCNEWFLIQGDMFA